MGWELQRALQPLGQVIALDRTQNKDGLSGDLANFEAITQAINIIDPGVVVNAAAYTAVDKAETDQSNADLINHLAVKHLAELCKSRIYCLYITQQTMCLMVQVLQRGKRKIKQPQLICMVKLNEMVSLL